MSACPGPCLSRAVWRFDKPQAQTRGSLSGLASSLTGSSVLCSSIRLVDRLSVRVLLWTPWMVKGGCVRPRGHPAGPTEAASTNNRDTCPSSAACSSLGRARMAGAEHRVRFVEAAWKRTLGEVGEEVQRMAPRRAPPTRGFSGAWCAALLGVAAVLLLVQPAGSALHSHHVLFHRTHTRSNPSDSGTRSTS